MSFVRHNGVWTSTEPLPNNSPGYWEGLLDALNDMDPLFFKAQETSDFEFICTLLRFKGMQDAGWDTLETIEYLFDSYTKIREKIKYEGDAKAHFSLFFYGLTVEASEPYEVLANLLNIIEGKRFITHNFPDIPNQRGKLTPQPPIDKINQLKSRAKKLKLHLSFFDKFYDNKLRNAVFHSDFAIHNNEFRIISSGKIYHKKNILQIVNKAQAYIETFFRLYYDYIKSYNEPKVIKVAPNFAHFNDEEAIVIVRKDHGVIGLKDNLTSEQVKNGRIPWNLIRYLPYEKKLIEDGVSLLPKNRIEQINSFLNHLPGWLRVILARKLKNISWLR